MNGSRSNRDLDSQAGVQYLSRYNHINPVMDKVIETHGLTKKFGGLMAIRNLNLTIEDGEILGIIGPNGAGKTTLFNLICGFYKPDSGLVKFLGEDITGLRPDEICERGVARTFQQVKLFPDMTVLENVITGALNSTGNLDSAKKEAEEWVVQVGLDDVQDEPVANLPAGKRKLTEVARSMATNPDLLLLDELVPGLTTAEIGEVLKLLQELNKIGITICLIEHVMEAVMNISERIVVLHDGKKIREGEPEEVSSDEKVIRTYLGEEEYA